MEVMCVYYTFRSDIMSQLPFFQSISVTILFPHSVLPFRTSWLRSLWSSPPSACLYQQVLQNIFFLNSYVAMDHKAGTLLPFIDDFINVIFSHFLDDLFNVFFSICLFTGAASLVRFILCRLIYLGNVEFTWILKKSAINYL